jgi:hypothetical protein
MIADKIRGALPKLILNDEINEAIKLLIYLEDNGLATKEDKELLYSLEK